MYNLSTKMFMFILMLMLMIMNPLPGGNVASLWRWDAWGGMGSGWEVQVTPDQTPQYGFQSSNVMHICKRLFAFSSFIALFGVDFQYWPTDWETSLKQKVWWKLWNIFRLREVNKRDICTISSLLGFVGKFQYSSIVPVVPV